MIDPQKFPMFHKKMLELAKPIDQRMVFNAQDTVQCLYEATTWMFEQVDQMELEDKDIFIVLGPTRTGKGTLLTALQGVQMQLFRRKDWENNTAAKQAYQAYFMAPIVEGQKPGESNIISH